MPLDSVITSDQAWRVSEVRFARSDDVHIAYRVVGDGPHDLVYVQGAFTHLQSSWQLGPFRRFCEKLAEFGQLILFDKRGMGMSDRVPGATPLETRMDDIRAVMDAAGSERATIMGASEGGPLSILFAAAHPDRVAGLVLMGAEVRERRDADWPWGEATLEEFERSMSTVGERWGSGKVMATVAPSAGDEPWIQEWAASMLLNAATPGSAEAFMRMAFEIDVREVASSVRVPTLILHAVGDRVCHVENGRFLARSIPGARLVELPGEDHVPWFQPDDVIAHIREFVSGERIRPEPERVLKTVLFTDIVGSTQTAGRSGDRQWRNLLEAHNDSVRSELERFRGEEVNTTGDGFIATFDGPARAVRSALAIQSRLLNLGITVRAGIHTGEIELLEGDIAGIAVHIASRILDLAGPGEVLVSGTVRDLVAGSGLIFVDRGRHGLRGIDGEWQVLEASDG